MDFLKEQYVCGVVTQGRASGPNHFVKEFKIQVGPNEENLEYLKDESGNEKVGR